MRDRSDEELMQAYAKGEMKAFDDLYGRHRGPLYRYILRELLKVLVLTTAIARSR